MSAPTASVPRSLGVLTRRPALPLILLFIAGILIHSIVPAEPMRLLIAIAVTALAAAFTLHRRFINSALLGAAIILCGVGIAQREQLQYPANHIGLFAGDEPRLAQVELQLIDEPRFEYSLLENFRPLPPKQAVEAEVLCVKTWNGWIPATGRTSLQIDQIQPRINIGQIVRVLGTIERPPPAANPGQFDWAAYYRQQRILATLTALRTSNIQILSDPGPSILDWLRMKARHLLAAGFTFDHALDHAMLRALLLGDRDPMLAGLRKEFQRTGVAFQLSVSGIHIAILAAVMLWLCRLARLRPRYSLLITTAFVLLYAAVALPSYSGARWVILCAAAAVGMWTRRQTDHFQMLSLAVFAMLFWHPLDIYTAGFQLSVSVVFTLALLYPGLRAFALSQMDPHEIVAMSFVKPTRLRSIWNRAKQWAFYLTAFAIINFFATLPLLAWHFGQLNLWTLLCSVLLFPITLICLLGGVLKLFLTLLCPGLAFTWAMAADWPIMSLRHAVDFLAKLPGGNIMLIAPPPWLIVTYYILLFLPLAPANASLRLPPSLATPWRPPRRRGARDLFPVLVPSQPITPIAITSHHAPITGRRPMRRNRAARWPDNSL